MEENLITDQLIEDQPVNTVEDSENILLEKESTEDLSKTLTEDLLEEEVTVQQPPLSESDKLIQTRTGYWPLHLPAEDIKWIKHSCQNKFEYTGPNEAYMLMNCFVGFSTAVERMKSMTNPNEAVLLPASAIEACAFFTNKHSGSGIDGAQRMFRIAMALNPIIMEMRKLDEIIEATRKLEAEAKALESELKENDESVATADSE